MWNQDKQQRLDALRVSDEQGTLTDNERSELSALFAELDADEAAALTPALERMQEREAALHAEHELVKAEATALQLIAREQEKLLTEAGIYLSGLRARRVALADKYRRVSGRELAVSR